MKYGLYKTKYLNVLISFINIHSKHSIALCQLELNAKELYLVRIFKLVYKFIRNFL